MCPILLRALQEKEIERLGGNKVLPVDVRVIVATNRNLAQEVKAGRFRADLYYRLSIFPIHLPPLRERPEDIALLAEHFAQKYSRKLNNPYRGIKQKAMRQLLTYEWPGNIRELENLVEQAVILCAGTLLEWGRFLEPALVGKPATAGANKAVGPLAPNTLAAIKAQKA